MSLSDAQNPFAELDTLYTLILHPLEVDFPLMKQLLHAILRIRESVTLSFLDDFLQLSAGTAGATLYDLHSILCFSSPNSNGTIHFHQKSLKDFLSSSE